VKFKLPIVLGVASLEYAANDLLLATEYGRWWAHVESSVPAVVPETETINERFYFMASYRIAPWFTPGAYYSLFFPDTTDREGRDAYQHDVALTLRYDLNPHWILKLEGHYMNGTASLSSALNGNRPLDELKKDWGVFLAKTTAYF
jgi:hypothetical protein